MRANWFWLLAYVVVIAAVTFGLMRARIELLRTYGTREAQAEWDAWRDDAARIGHDGADTIALHLAVSKRNLATIRWLLAHGVAVDAKRSVWDCNHTALHMTVESGAFEVARLLLDAGADPNIRDDKYRATALGWAGFFGRGDFADLIRERGGVE